MKHVDKVNQGKLKMIQSKKIALETINLTKKFGNITAVDGISFKIREGDILGILGPNGAGKTTTIRLITGIFKLENPSCVKIYSKDLSHSRNELKRMFGIVPEISNAYSDFTVYQNLVFSGTIYGLTKEKIKERIKELLRRFELTEKKYAKTKTLSKGLKQRLNLCLALLHEPSILILDEPLSGLDPISVNIVRNQILDLKREGKTILITTHNMKEAQQVCDQVLIMNKGKIIADEKTDNLLKKVESSSRLMFRFKEKVSQDQKNELLSLFSSIDQKKGLFTLTSNNLLEDISTLNSFRKKHNLTVANLNLKETSLEDAFIYLIKNDVQFNSRSSRSSDEMKNRENHEKLGRRA